jgi:hypothetical protein
MRCGVFLTWVVLSLVCAPVASALDVSIVNDSGRPDSSVYVMLHNGSSSDGQLTNDQPKKLSDLPRKRFTLDKIAAGRIFFSYDKPVTSAEPPQSPVRYDKVELTYPGMANLTAVDFFSIPFRMVARDAQGNVVGRLDYTAPTDTIRQQMLAIPGARGALVTGANGEFLRVLSPLLSPNSYPSFDQAIRAMAGQTVTVRGAYYGTPFQKFVATGAFSSDGSITLKTSIGPSDDQLRPGQDLTVQGNTLTRAIYTVDGDYTVGGRPAKVSDNDVYSAIYRDLLSGFAWGYWGGKYGNDSAQWQGKPPFEAARTSPEPYTTFNQYAAVIYNNSTSYGFPFSDTGPKQVQLPLDNAARLTITIKPDSGGRARSEARTGPQARRLLPATRSTAQVGAGGVVALGRASCPPTCGQVTLRATRRSGRRAVVVGRGTVRLRNGATRRLALSLNRAGRRQLARRGRLTVKLSVSVRAPGGRVARDTRTLTLRARR